jgi:hypothetical protein
MIGQQAIVRVEEDHVRAGALLKSAVPGFGDALVGLTNIPYVGIPLHDLVGIVRRAVVDDDNLKASIGLREDTLDRFTQIRPAYSRESRH